jgi:hypothetical protein
MVCDGRLSAAADHAGRHRKVTSRDRLINREAAPENTATLAEAQTSSSPTAVSAVAAAAVPELLTVKPVRRGEVRRFIGRHQSHPVRPGALFRLGAEAGGELVGVAIVGRPQAHISRSERAAEVLRVCTDRRHPGALDLLYQAIGQVARASGYVELITYAGHGREAPGLIAEGWHQVGRVEVLKRPDLATDAALRVAPRWRWVLDSSRTP